MTAATEPIVSLRSVARTHRATRRSPAREALRSVSLDVHAGEWIALLGPNGAGKSTLLRLIAGVEAPTSGDVSVLGMNPSRQAREVRRSLGLVFQQPALDALLTVRENLELFGAMHGMQGNSLDDAVRAAAKSFDLDDRLNDRVRTLSGGLKRRADLARAVLPRPRLLLVDEPTTGLDHQARSGFLDLLEDLRRRHATTIVMSTHLMDEASRADRVVMLAEGRVVADGAPDALRSGLGSAAMRASADAADGLRAAGLAVESAKDGVIGRGDPDALAAGAAALARSGEPFWVSPPTLGDVYLARTGRSLDAEGAAS